MLCGHSEPLAGSLPYQKETSYPSVSVRPSPHPRLVFRRQKTVSGITVDSEMVEGVFLLKALVIRFGLCNATSLPGDAEMRNTSSSHLFNLLQSQFACVQQHTANLYQAPFPHDFVSSLWKR